jgi:hypothetical protein
MNTRTITKKVGTVVVAGSILLLMNATRALGQDAEDKRDQAASPDIAYTAENLRDPFDPYVLPKQAPVILGVPVEGEELVPLPQLTIAGITWGSKFPQAIVNGKIVREGDVIEDARIVSISKDGVIISFHNREVKLPAPGAISFKK